MSHIAVLWLLALMGALALRHIDRPGMQLVGAGRALLDTAEAGVKLVAMGYLGETRNAALKKMGEENTYLGVFKLASATTGWKSINAKELEKTSHGYETGNLIYIKEMSEGGSGLVKKGEFFYVEKVSANVIKLSQTESIEAEEWTVEIKGTVEFQLLEETTETRKKVEWAAAAKKAKLESKEKYECAVAEKEKVAVVGYWTEVSGGTATKPKNVRVVETVTPEEVGKGKTFAVTSATLDLLSQ